MLDTFPFRILAASVVASLGLTITAAATCAADDKPLVLHTRFRQAAKPDAAKSADRMVEKTVEWDPKKTALVICDMWDRHWCAGAERRVAELAGPMNVLVKAARNRGLLIVHAPSTCVDFYKDTPARRRAQSAPFAKSPVPLATTERWGTAWCWLDKDRESDLPIDDSDMGCDCANKCKIHTPWTRQIAAIEIKDLDAITDNGQETINLFSHGGIDNVIILGVHTNMCVLGRPFAIRQMVKVGKNVLLVRDMTDTMYNHEKKPHVDHFTGTDIVVGHIERHWCPTIASTDLTGKPPFRFAEDNRKK